MRYQEFELTEDELFELKMSPTNLSKMAKNIDARVGMEFELIVPGVEGDEDEFESEPDMDADERFPVGPGWERDIMSFFRGGSMGNSTRSIQQAIDELNENFYEWLSDQEEEYINSAKGQDSIRKIATDNVDRNDYESDEEYDLALQEFIDHNEDRIREELIDEFRDDLDDHFYRWLDEEQMESMYSFASEYDLDWPYWTEPEYYGRGDGISIDSVADEFGAAIGRPVNASRSYHGATRQPGYYVVEPDGSLSGDEPGDSGLEFVSPPLTIDEMLSDLDKVVKWAKAAGAYTNDSTGLHINVSVPNQQDLDFVKLAMFLGDDYILEQFGREGNTYCKSALKKIRTQAASSPDRVEEMMRQFQGGLNQLASKILHTGSTEKYSSINNRGGWVEFRGPGGNWLGGDLGTVKNTLLRAVVALDVATKPEEFKQEYYKKLYKTLNPKGDEDAIQYFARYAAGELPQSALKSFIKQIQTQRQVKKQQPGQLYWWNVAVDGQRIEVVAKDKQEAWEKATKEYREWQRYDINQAEIRALRPYVPDPESLDMAFVWKVTGSASSPYQSQGTEVVATNEAGAIAAAVQKWNLNIGNRSIQQFTQGWRAVPQRPATQQEIEAQAGSPATVNNRRYYWVYIEDAPERGVRVMAANEYAAKQIASMEHARMFASAAFNDINAAVLTTTDGRDLPGAVQDIARQQLAAQSSAASTTDSHPEGRGRPHDPNGRYAIVSREDPAAYQTGRGTEPEYLFRFNMSNPAEQHNGRYILAAWAARNNVDPANYMVVDAERWNEPATVPGSTQDLQRQRLAAQMPRFEPQAGNWEVYSIATDNSVYKFAANTEEEAVRAYNIWQDAVRDPSLPRQGFNLRAVQQQARGSESLPPGNARWLVLDRDDNEVYSFINTTAQSDANQYARDWMINRAPREVRDNGPFTIVPAR